MNLHRSLRGRLEMEPIAVVDIGSNSVRLVVYEGAVRAPTPVFNEKIQCGLGRTLAQDGRLPEQAMEQAITALRRFHALTRTLRAKHVRVLATAAVREAINGAEFISRAEAAIQQSVEILSGEREAELAGAGVRTGFASPDGLAGDLGGGSLELINMAGDTQSNAVTLPIGGLRLAGQSGGDFAKAGAIVDAQLDSVAWLGDGRDRLFYPVGGTWRSMAKLHMQLADYPLRVMHAYAIETDAFRAFCNGIIDSAIRGEKYEGYEHVSKARRDLLPYGALVAQKLLERAAPRRVFFSASGIREGLVYSLLSPTEQRKDPLIEACVDLASRRSRSVTHARELKRWTDPLFVAGGLDETPEETRLRDAASLISDIGWRAHPDYRADQSLDTVINSALVSIDHPGRMYLALSIFFRHAGVGDAHDRGIPLGYRKLAGPRLVARARVIAGAVRTAHMLSAGMPGVIDETRLSIKAGKLRLHLPQAYGELSGERLQRRLNALARLVECEGQVVVDN
ncbi:MAG: exopolyphosphatase/guanosine-5'-triphosphate,3'-diphosphate pyrophosphatase [Hyphomicrobiaceae bacterium]|jgi:exopolyphosphatase/guanosine-5'-triphosphate,3'-diphosphate pyrophosphatase